MKVKIVLSALIFLLVASPAISFAGVTDDNALAAIALYIDTSGRYVPGLDMLNKALNEVIRYKVNALFLGSEVQCGNEVLRELKRYNVATAADATPDALTAYAKARHVNYIILLAVHPLDVTLDIKAYSSAANAYIVDKTVTAPDGGAALSMLDSLSGLLGDELASVLTMIIKG
ncbi:hypothetical protein TcarDRAFT_2518 [Thermosinus carboxydivorans Nor1]|uniref:Uncharacterized protein n=1 Tax=Thermosinus carboxydivorans Nor1 TaxID=401526 RepID=A1HLX6_9FIRM|nr:hypothetical protein [Thermosinus carboxydivorans]EAX48829.1 hypothetical protein TcarDRAFT_2518 [Thermosinus carboxydivorans Nor1]